MCEECKRRQQEEIQRTATGDLPVSTAPPSVAQVISQPGQRLDGPTRSFMEHRFGQDFGQVRIHNDREAADSAEAVNARAYTVGRNVVFNRGEYRPDTNAGRQLLAHELVHSLQQSVGGFTAVSTPALFRNDKKRRKTPPKEPKKVSRPKRLFGMTSTLFFPMKDEK